MRKQVHLFCFYLRCYVVWSKLRGHQVSLVYFGKAKVTQLHRCVLQNRQNYIMRIPECVVSTEILLAASCEIFSPGLHLMEFLS